MCSRFGRFCWPLGCLGASALFFLTTASAQAQQSSTPTRTLFGSSTTGGNSTSGSSTTQNRTLFGSQSTSAQQGSTSGRTSSANSGMSTFGSSSGISGLNGGQAQGGFVGRQSNDQNSYVGRQSQDQTGASRQNNSRGTQNRRTNNRRTSGRNVNSDRSGQRGSNFNDGADFSQGGNRRTSSIQVVYRMDIPQSQPAPSTTTERIGKRLQNSRSLVGASDLSATSEEGTLVLRGRVADEYQRRLAEQIARLDPAVHRVRNELTVASKSDPQSSETPQ